MSRRFNAPPNWPAPPLGWTPPVGWKPDPAWGPAPPGWQFWLDEAAYENNRYPMLPPLRYSPEVVRRKRLGAGWIVLLLVVIILFAGCAALVSSSLSSPQGSQSSSPSKQQIDAAKELTQRDLALLVKNPDSFKGKTMVLYASITQFDSATGPCTFRANIAHKNMEMSWDYDKNSVFSGGDGVSDCPDLGTFVAKDEVRITATSLGSLSYDTQIGGRTTVPSFRVEKISALK